MIEPVHIMPDNIDYGGPRVSPILRNIRRAEQIGQQDHLRNVCFRAGQSSKAPATAGRKRPPMTVSASVTSSGYRAHKSRSP